MKWQLKKRKNCYIVTPKIEGLITHMDYMAYFRLFIEVIITPRESY